MFDSDVYKVKQKVLSLGNKYTIYEDGEKILESKQKKLKLKEDFRFYSDDEPVLKVTTDQILDVAASYTVTDERTDEVVGALKRDWTFFKHRWQLIDTENNVIGTVEESNILLALLRRFVFEFFPFKYSVTAPDGNLLGKIDGKFAIRDTYEVDLSSDKDEKLDRRLAVAAAVLIDAIEKN